MRNAHEYAGRHSKFLRGKKRPGERFLQYEVIQSFLRRKLQLDSPNSKVHQPPNFQELGISFSYWSGCSERSSKEIETFSMVESLRE